MPMKLITMILALVLHVAPGEHIQDALRQARQAYAERGETTTIYLAPGTYYEELTIDVPGLRLINEQSAIDVHDGGVSIGPNAVRISWYCGHGYQYASMGDRPNYGGSRERRWNASVLVTAPDFYAEGIIFENSFNLYVSRAELLDTLVDISQSNLGWTEKERPKRQMPDRPRELNSTLVQNKYYRERASAISFTEGARNATLRHCRVVGRQDAFYGDHGASVLCDSCILCGAVDYIFGGLELTVRHSELVAMVNTEHGDRCYIAAGRGYVPTADDVLRDSVPASEYATQGMLFVDCTVRYATNDELVNPGSVGTTDPIWLCRPWRWWGKHVFLRTRAAAGVLPEDPISLGLTKGHPCPYVEINQ